MFKQLKLVIGVALTATLVACGGGDDSAPAAPVASTETFALKTAYVNFVNENRVLQYTISGRTGNNEVSGSGTTYASNTTGYTFEGQQALGKIVTSTGTVSVGGKTAPFTSYQTEYYDSSYKPLGKITSEYEVVTSAVNIPDRGKVGDTGIVYTANRFQSSSKNVLFGTNTVTYTIEPDTASTAVVRWTETEKDTYGVQTDVSTVLYRITTTGSITRLSQTSDDGTNYAVFTYK